MPYINKDNRKQILTGRKPQGKGELCFLVYYIASLYIVETGTRYPVISDAIAALNDAAEEIRRRILNPYEDKKMAENGDIVLPK